MIEVECFEQFCYFIDIVRSLYLKAMLHGIRTSIKTTGLLPTRSDTTEMLSDTRRDLNHTCAKINNWTAMLFTSFQAISFMHDMK